MSNPFTAPVAVDRGGTGRGSFNRGDIIYGENGGLSVLPLGSDGQLLTSDSIKPYWSSALYDLNTAISTLQSQQTYASTTLTSLTATSDSYVTRLSSVSDAITNDSAIINSLITQSSNQDQKIIDARSQLQSLQTSLTGVGDLTTAIQAEDLKTTGIEMKLKNINTQLGAVDDDILQAEDNINHLSSNINSFGMYKNKIINGNFSQWQRAENYVGQMPISGIAYLAADRWAVLAGSTVTVVMQKTTGIIGSGPSTNRLVNALHVSFSGAGGKTLRHNIENARTLQGQQCTITFWAKGPAFQLTLQLRQNFGGSAVTVFSTPFDITENYTQFSYTFQMPTVPSNQTMGPSNSVQLNFMSSVNWSLDIANVQLEQGPPSTFEYRPAAMELMLCQRYYEIGFAYLLCYAYLSTTPFVNCIFKIDKRIVPSVKSTVVNSSSFTTNLVQGPVSLQQLAIGCTKNNYSTDGSFNIRWTADSEIY
jgi:hypothetical protein